MIVVTSLALHKSGIVRFPNDITYLYQRTTTVPKMSRKKRQILSENVELLIYYFCTLMGGEAEFSGK